MVPAAGLVRWSLCFAAQRQRPSEQADCAFLLGSFITRKGLHSQVCRVGAIKLG